MESRPRPSERVRASQEVREAAARFLALTEGGALTEPEESYTLPGMTPHSISIRFRPSDVNIGLVKQVARTVVGTLHILDRETAREDDTGDVRLRFYVQASGRPEAERTARVLAGAVKPLVQAFSVRTMVAQDGGPSTTTPQETI